MHHKNPLIAVTINGGETWQTKSIINNTYEGSLFSVSCTGEGATAFCAALGKNGPYYLPVQSKDGGKTWRDILLKPRYYIFLQDVHCAGSGSQATCGMVGFASKNGFHHIPIIIQTNDGGAIWIIKPIHGLSDVMNGDLTSISCTKKEANAFCFAAEGKVENSKSEPFLFQNINGNNHWEIKSINKSYSIIYLTATNCNKSQIASLCTAVGWAGNTFVNLPVLVQTIDGGQHWLDKEILNLPYSGKFFAISCTGGGPNAMCIAVGKQERDEKSMPLLVQSTDAGFLWRMINLDEMMLIRQWQT